MFAYFNVSEPEYLDYETDKESCSKPGRLTISKWCSFKIQRYCRGNRVNLIVKQEILPLDLAFQTLKNYLKRRNR
jgi:hypothetical protein